MYTVLGYSGLVLGNLLDRVTSILLRGSLDSNVRSCWLQAEVLRYTLGTFSSTEQRGVDTALRTGCGSEERELVGERQGKVLGRGCGNAESVGREKGGFPSFL